MPAVTNGTEEGVEPVLDGLIGDAHLLRSIRDPGDCGVSRLSHVVHVEGVVISEQCEEPAEFRRGGPQDRPRRGEKITALVKKAVS